MLVGLHESVVSTIVDYLTPPERLKLSRTCKHYRELSKTEFFWPRIHLNDRENYYDKFLEWCFNHINQISPSTLQLTLFQCTPVRLTRIVEFFNQGIKSLTQLNLWALRLEQNQQYLLLWTICNTLKRLKSLSTTIFVEDRPITEKLSTLERLYIVGQDIVFSGVCLERLPNLQTLVIKPHDLDFGLLTKYIERSGKDLRQLEVDCENYPVELFIRMMMSLNPSTLSKLRLYHLENIDGQSFSNLSRVANLQELIITKAYQISNSLYSDVFGKTHWPYLTRLDISESIYLEDEPLVQLVRKSRKLRSIKVAWCTKLTSRAIEFIVDNCLSVEQLVVTGVKRLNDSAFKDFQKILVHFDEGQYLKVKQRMKLETTVLPKDISNIFGGRVDLTEGVPTLRQLRLLDCVSCDAVSNKLLEVVSLLAPTAMVLDYYSNRMGLHLTDPLFE